MMSLTGDKKPSPLLQTPFNEGHPQISLNGKWIAYSSNETRRSEIYARPFPSGDGSWPISVNGGTFARWSSDGTELFYMSATSLGKLISVKVNPAGPTFQYGEPTVLFDSGYVNFTHGLNYHTYAVSPDGQRFPHRSPRGAPKKGPHRHQSQWSSTGRPLSHAERSGRSRTPLRSGPEAPGTRPARVSETRRRPVPLALSGVEGSVEERHRERDGVITRQRESQMPGTSLDRSRRTSS